MLNMNVLGTDDIAIEFGGPEYGWLEIYFKQKDKKPFLIEASDVYQPFSAIKKWLENMLDYCNFPSMTLNIDCERYNVLLSYDYLEHYEQVGHVWPVALVRIGIKGDSPQVQLAVPIHLFVSKFYYSLKTYIFANRETFRRHWHLPNCNYFEFRRFIRYVESKNIEQRLADA